MVFLAFLLAILQTSVGVRMSQPSIRRSAFANGSKCMPRFYKEPSHFDPCKSAPCFVFLSEIPFIVLDKNMTSDDAVMLFPCKDRKIFFPGLHGISFDIMDQLPLQNALCVYGGPSCTFEGMMHFVGNQKELQFVAGGFMFNLPHRLTENTFPSSPLMGDKIVIVGRRDSQNRIAQAYTTVARPFQFGTWMVCCGVLLFFFLIALVIAFYFAEPRTPENIARNLIGEPGSNPRGEMVHLFHIAAVKSLKLALTASLTLGILFYEIALVNFVFLKKTPALQTNLGNLPQGEMAKYGIPKGGATEVIWKIYVDPENKYVNQTPPWHFCSDHQDCLNQILDESSPVKFTMTHESFIRHELKQRKLCDSVSVYETKRPLYEFSAGWYYGAVPVKTRIKIDKAILNLRLHDKIRKLVNRHIDADMSLNCSAMSADIPPAILGWLLLFIAAVFMILVLGLLIRASQIKRRSKKRPMIERIVH